MSYSSINLSSQQFNNLVLTNLVILVAGISCNCETWRYWYTDVVHLGQVSTLTAEYLTHGSVTLSLSVAESIDSFLTHV